MSQQPNPLEGPDKQPWNCRGWFPIPRPAGEIFQVLPTCVNFPESAKKKKKQPESREVKTSPQLERQSQASFLDCLPALKSQELGKILSLSLPPSLPPFLPSTLSNDEWKKCLGGEDFKKIKRSWIWGGKNTIQYSDYVL